MYHWILFIFLLIASLNKTVLFPQRWKQYAYFSLKKILVTSANVKLSHLQNSTLLVSTFVLFLLFVLPCSLLTFSYTYLHTFNAHTSSTSQKIPDERRILFLQSFVLYILPLSPLSISLTIIPVLYQQNLFIPSIIRHIGCFCQCTTVNYLPSFSVMNTVVFYYQCLTIYYSRFYSLILFVTS